MSFPLSAVPLKKRTGDKKKKGRKFSVTSVFHKLVKLLEEVVPLFRIKLFLRL